MPGRVMISRSACFTAHGQEPVHVVVVREAGRQVDAHEALASRECGTPAPLSACRARTRPRRTVQHGNWTMPAIRRAHVRIDPAHLRVERLVDAEALAEHVEIPAPVRPRPCLVRGLVRMAWSREVVGADVKRSCRTQKPSTPTSRILGIAQRVPGGVGVQIVQVGHLVRLFLRRGVGVVGDGGRPVVDSCRAVCGIGGVVLVEWRLRGRMPPCASAMRRKPRAGSRGSQSSP